MNTDLKNKWIQAMESGEYQFGSGELRDDDNCFCALGVLCNIIDPGKWFMSENRATRWYDPNCNTFIPENIQEEIGITQSQITNIWNLNDIYKSYQPVIDYIKENL